MTTQELFEQAKAMVERDESASLAGAITYVAMVELSKTDGANTPARRRALANDIWAVARQHGYDVE